MHLYYLIPVAATLANLALIVEFLTRKDRFSRLFLLWLALIAAANALSAGLLISDEAASRALFAILRPVIFFAGASLCLVCLAAAGFRTPGPVGRAALLFASAGALLVLASLFFEREPLVAAYEARSFGTFPRLQPLGLAVFGVLIGGGAIASLTALLRPRAPPDIRSFPIFALFWWLGLALNALPLAGLDMPPLATAVDAIVCVFFVRTLPGRRAGWWSVAPAALTIGLIAAFLATTLEFLSTDAQLAAGTALAALAAALLGAGAGGAKAVAPGETRLRENWARLKLTRQEERICELLMEGYTRKQIAFFLGVTAGTLRNHLASIYAKTLGPGGGDQLQRLTIYLHANASAAAAKP